MSEQPERTRDEAQEVLQSSELTARLLRRLTVSPGIIDVFNLRQFAERLAGGITRPLSLLNELLARHGIDDRLTIENPSLLMEQPWMVNINAYLTNYNSFSSTTNQFTSSVARSQSHSSTALSTASPSSHSSQSSMSSIISSEGPPSPETHSRLRGHDAKSALGETTSLPAGTMPLPAGKFRVSRSPARRGLEKHLTGAQDMVRQAKLKPAKDSTAPALSLATAEARIEEGKIQEKKVDAATVLASADTTPTNLPLALTQIVRPQIQRKSLAENANVSRPLAKIREIKDTQEPAEAERPAVPADTAIELKLVKPTREKRRVEEKKTTGSSHSVPGRERVPSQRGSVPTQTSKPDSVPTITATTALPLVKQQAASSPIQQRPPDFIWRKGVDVPTLKEFASAISKASPLQSLNRTTGSAFPAQSQPQHSQTFTPEGARRKDESRAGSGISTERILRNISRKLLIERERRGY